MATQVVRKLSNRQQDLKKQLHAAVDRAVTMIEIANAAGVDVNSVRVFADGKGKADVDVRFS